MQKFHFKKSHYEEMTDKNLKSFLTCSCCCCFFEGDSNAEPQVQAPLLDMTPKC